MSEMKTTLGHADVEKRDDQKPPKADRPTPNAKGKANVASHIGKFFVYFAAALTFGMLILIVGNVLLIGVPHLKPSLFEWNYTSENASMTFAIFNTIEMIIITLLACVPIGIMTAIYMVEYAKPGNKFVKVARLMTETLQGIPSIVYGLFGYIFFYGVLGWGYSLLGGSLTMAMMCLPLIIRSTEEALMAVPRDLREASYGLGARKLRTVFLIVLPAASMGIFSGIILSIGRIVGETAAIIYTAGSMTQLAGPMSGGRTLAIHMLILQSEALHRNEAYATAVVLLVVVVLINALSSHIEHKLKQKETGDV